MNIALVCCEYPVRLSGGGGVATRHIAELLRAQGHHVRITGIYLPNTLQKDDHEPDFHPIIQASGRFSWITARRNLFRHIRQWSANGEIDIVEVPLTRGLAASWGGLSVPVIIRIHGSQIAISNALGHKAPFIHRYLESRALRRADAVSTVSRAILDSIADLTTISCNTTVIPNPVSIPALERLPTDTPTLVFAGAHSRAKGIDTLLDAWQQLGTQHPDAELHLYGRNETDITHLIPESLRGRTYTHGHVDQDQLHQAFATATLAVFPSRYEAFGLACAEAMACACPVITSAAGFGEMLVDDHQSGLVIPPDNPDALTAAVNELLANPEKAAELAQAARAKITKTYDPRTMLSQTLGLYESAIK